MADKDTLNLIKFKFGSFQSIKDLSSKDQSSFYFASDKPAFYNAGLWYGVSSLTSSVNEETGEVTLVINGDFGDNWESSQVKHTFVAGMTTQQKADLEKAVSFVNSVTSTEGEDTQTIIDKWNEIVNFLKGFKDTDVLLERISTIETNVTNLQNTTITGGDGLTGGGNLLKNRTIALGTPSTITDKSINEATGTTHTHAIDEASTEQRGIVRLNDTLTSESTDQALTANQGRVLKEHIDDMFELIDKGNGVKEIKAKYGLWSDSFISARGVDNESGGVGGLDAQAVWDLLMQNDDATKIINVAHIPDITIAKITDIANASVANAVNAEMVGGYNATKFIKQESNIKTSIYSDSFIGYGSSEGGWISYGAALNIGASNGYGMLMQMSLADGYIYTKARKAGVLNDSWKQLAFRETTLAGYGITDAVTLNTDQTISGAKTFSNGIHLNNTGALTGDCMYTGYLFKLGGYGNMLTFDTKATSSWSEEIKFSNSSNADNVVSAKMGVFGGASNIHYLYFGLNGQTNNDATFKVHPTTATINNNVIWHAGNMGEGSGLNADQLDGMHASDLTSSVIYPRKLDGILIKSKAKFSQNRHNIVTIKGANYADYDKPYFTIVEFYSYAAGGYFYNVASSNIGHKIPEIKIFTIDDSVYIWFQHGMYQTFVVDWNCSDILGNNVESITNSAFPTEGVSRLETTTPINVAYENSNVASATKLETPRTIWGQRFDGTNNVSGALYLGANSILGGDNLNILSHSASGYLEIGYGNATAGYSTYINGNSIHFRYSTSHNTGMLLSSNGNVGIGTVAPTAKLHVDGDSIINGKLTVDGNQVKFKNPSLYIGTNDAQIYFHTNSGTALVIENMAVRPSTENGTLGTAAKKWQNIYTESITIGNATLYWDVANQCLRVNSGIASDSFLSAKGIDTTGNGQGGGGGFDAQMLWNELTISSPTNAGKVISSQFLPVQEILTPVASDISAINAEIIALQDRIANIEQALTWQTL